ncbi:MAG TPA: hypothetical protein VFI08_11280, partial [Spirochaetia bacterium]|nr:hypothetical protein [Spirochaetia bacterium]
MKGLRAAAALAAVLVLAGCSASSGPDTPPTTTVTVYAGGFATSGKTTVAGYWKDGAWNGLANPHGASYDASVNAVLVSGSTVYAGGYALTSGGAADSGDWQNGSWVSLSVGNGGVVNALTASSTDFYAAGYGISGKVNVPGYWKGTTWNPLDNSFGVG